MPTGSKFSGLIFSAQYFADPAGCSSMLPTAQISAVSAGDDAAAAFSAAAEAAVWAADEDDAADDAEADACSARALTAAVFSAGGVV